MIRRAGLSNYLWKRALLSTCNMLQGEQDDGKNMLELSKWDKNSNACMFGLPGNSLHLKGELMHDNGYDVSRWTWTDSVLIIGRKSFIHLTIGCFDGNISFFSALSSHTVANSPYQSLVSNSYWRKKAICGKGNFKVAAGLWRKCYTDSHPLLDFNVFFNVFFWISKFQCIFGFQSCSWQWRKCYTDSLPFWILLTIHIDQSCLSVTIYITHAPDLTVKSRA